MNCLHLNRCQPLTGDDYALLRQNPDRGFRLEAYLRLGSGSAVFHPGFLAGAYLENNSFSTGRKIASSFSFTSISRNTLTGRLMHTPFPNWRRI